MFEDSSKVGFGGGQQVTLQALRFFKNSGFRIVLVDTVTDSKFQNMVAGLVDEHLCLPTFGSVQNKNKSAFNTSVLELILFPLFLMRNVWYLYRYIGIRFSSSENCQSYVCAKKGLPYAYVLRKRFGIPYVFHVHNYHAPSSLFFRGLIFFMKQARTNICVSTFVQRTLPLKNTVVIHNPVLTHARVSPRKNIPKPVILAYVGSLLTWKGVQVLLDSLKHLPQETKLWIFGEGNYADILKKRADPQRVLFKGFVPNVWAEHEAQIAAVVVPSLAPEAFGMVAAETLGHGIPVLASNLGALPEVLGENLQALLFTPGDARDLAKKASLLLNDRDAYIHYSFYAIQQALNFSCSSFNRKFCDVFNTKLNLKKNMELALRR